MDSVSLGSIWNGNVFAIVDHAGESGFDSVNRMVTGVVFGVSEGDNDGELRASNEKGPVVVGGEFDPIFEHYFNPNCFFMAFTSPVPSSLPAPCIGNSDFR